MQQEQHEQHQQQASAPHPVDLDRDRQLVANLPLSPSPPLPNAPLVSQKRASRRAHRPPTTPNLNPITTSSPSLNQACSPFASLGSHSSSKSHPHASSRRDPDLTTDFPHKGLRPKSSYHQSLLNLRDEPQITSDSGVYHPCASSGFIS